jgi:ABC-type lipoprotein export system ATPase subunit
MPILAEKIGKRLGDPGVQILSDISLEIPEGEFIALTGRSGSGKSTLLYVLSSLDTASEGRVLADGIDFSKMLKRDIAYFRNQKVGFVFQFHYLISELSALENVLLPSKKFGQEKKWRPHAKLILEQMGLSGQMHRLPRHLSGGEQQRVAIARSLVMEPKYLFADEPTGALDSMNSEAVIEMLITANREKGTTVILVTHDAGYAKRAKRQIRIADGKIVSDTQTKV